jgi:hypothetical protein
MAGPWWGAAISTGFTSSGRPDRDAICAAIAAGLVKVDSTPLRLFAAIRTMAELMVDEWLP